MRMTLVIASALTLLCISGPAPAQVLPNDTDLKAAFCAGVLKSSVEGSAKSQPPTDPAIADLDKKSKEQLFAAQQRVLAYLMPRMQFVDQTSLMFALTEGGRAYEQNLTRWKECQWDPDSLAALAARDVKAMTAAMNSCMGPTGQRVRECYAPSFLPF